MFYKKPLDIRYQICYNTPRKQKNGSVKERQLLYICAGDAAAHTTGSYPHRSFSVYLKLYLFARGNLESIGTRGISHVSEP